MTTKQAREAPEAGEAKPARRARSRSVRTTKPAKTPKAEADKLAELLTRIERLPETRAFYERIGAEVMQGGPQEMREFQATEIRLWRRIAAQAKVELQ